MNRERSLQLIQVRQNDEHLMCAVVGVMPTLAKRRIEEVCHQTVRVARCGEFRFDQPRSVEFGETLQFVTGQAAKKIEEIGTVGRDGDTKEGTNQGRA